MTEPPRARTAAELRDEFLDCCRAAADYWAGPAVSSQSCEDRVRGLLHSVLCVIDGVSGGMHAFDLVAAPHPDDKAYYQENGENWSEPGTVINKSDYLHELLYHGMWEHLRGDRQPGDPS